MEITSLSGNFFTLGFYTGYGEDKINPLGNLYHFKIARETLMFRFSTLDFSRV